MAATVKIGLFDNEKPKFFFSLSFWQLAALGAAPLGLGLGVWLYYGKNKKRDSNPADTVQVEALKEAINGVNVDVTSTPDAVEVFNFSFYFNDSLFNIYFPETASVGDMKAILYERTGLPVSRQILTGWLKLPKSDKCLLSSLELPRGNRRGGLELPVLNIRDRNDDKKRLRTYIALGLPRKNVPFFTIPKKKKALKIDTVMVKHSLILIVDLAERTPI